MAISDRKEKIIQAVVDSYIVSCEPISSSEIRENYLPQLSSATIRNELSALEEMGYLAQPHTSSGRIPTAEAYRLYVDKLMPRRKLTKSEIKVINDYFDNKLTEIDDILRSTAKVISQITNLTAVAMIPNVASATIESIKVVNLTENLALVVIVTNLGVMKDATVELQSPLSDEYLLKASNFITSAFKGRQINDLLNPDEVIESVKREYAHLFSAIMSVIQNYTKGKGMSDIVLEGSAKVLDQPEYSSVSKAREMLEMFESKEKLAPLLTSPDDVTLNIKIGKEITDGESAPECAIVTASYRVNGVTVGNAGVIGPIRMDYSKVVSVLDEIGRTLKSAIPELDYVIENKQPEKK